MRVLLIMVLLSLAIPAAQNEEQPRTQGQQTANDKIGKAPELSPIQQTSAQSYQPNSSGKRNAPENEARFWGLTHGELVNSGLTLIYVVISLMAFFAIKRQANLTEKQGESSAAQFKEQIGAMTEAREQTDELIKQATAQAAALTKAAEATEKNAEAAKASADALRAGVEGNISKERARIRIGVGEMRPQSQPTSGPPILNMVACWLFNYGLTTAFIADFRARFILSDAPELTADYAQCRQLMYAESLQQDNGSNRFLVPLEPSQTLTEDEVLRIRKRQLLLHFYGFVTFRDVFDRERKTTIHVRRTMRFGGTIEGTIPEWWDPIGPAEENQETEEKI